MAISEQRFDELTKLIKETEAHCWSADALGDYDELRGKADALWVMLRNECVEVFEVKDTDNEEV